MKKLIAIAIIMVLCTAMVLPAVAADEALVNGGAELLVRTGDDSGEELALWGLIAGAALVAVVILIVIGSRGRKK
jgi:hypothetical protein